jgi:glycosyltransferase involved in cell wall biosynthesis
VIEKQMNAISSLPRLSLIIPCYNEATRVDLMYSGLAAFIKEWNTFLEIIIVDDGSSDSTAEVLQHHPVYLAHADCIRILHQENTGKGGALKYGCLLAKGDFVLTLDADMATHPKELLNWLATENNFNAHTIYIGSREHVQSTIFQRSNRKTVGHIFNYIVKLLTPLSIKDTQCGFKLYPVKWASTIFKDLQTNGWAHDVEILYKAHLFGLQIKEMPIEWHAIEGSKINVFTDGAKMFFEVLRISTQIKWSFNNKKIRKCN